MVLGKSDRACGGLGLGSILPYELKYFAPLSVHSQSCINFFFLTGLQTNDPTVPPSSYHPIFLFPFLAQLHRKVFLYYSLLLPSHSLLICCNQASTPSFYWNGSCQCYQKSSLCQTHSQVSVLVSLTSQWCVAQVTTPFFLTRLLHLLPQHVPFILSQLTGHSYPLFCWPLFHFPGHRRLRSSSFSLIEPL